MLLLRLVSVCPNISLNRAHRAATRAQGWQSISSSYGFRSVWTRSEAIRQRRLRSQSQSQDSARRLTARRQTVRCSAVSGESIRYPCLNLTSTSPCVMKELSLSEIFKQLQQNHGLNAAVSAEVNYISCSLDAPDSKVCR